MKHPARVLCLMIASLAISAWAEDTPKETPKDTPTPAPKEAPTDAAKETPDVNPRVVAKLNQMGDYLRSLSKFKVDANVTRDTVLDSGMKIQGQAVTTMAADGHNHFYAKIDGDNQTREFFYNGKKLTQYSPFMKYYTTVDAPDNIQDTLHKLETFYGMQIPMEDLFLFGTTESNEEAFTKALYVGPSTIKGKLCDHLAFRQPGVDWQLWITRSQTPLPCKLVITTTDDDTRPEYSAVYTWNLKPDPKSLRFTFKPTKGDVSIPFKTVGE